MNIKKVLTNSSTLHLFLLAGIAMAIPANRSLANAFIIISSLVGVFLLFQKTPSLNTLFKPVLAIPIIFYLYLLINGLFGYNDILLLKQLNKNLLFVLISFSTLILYKVSFYNRILKLYTYSLFSITIILLIHSIIKLISGVSSSAFYFHGFTELIDEHAVYFSLYLALGVFICLDQIQKRTNINFNKLMIVIFSIGLWFSASKAIMIATIALVFLYLLLQKSIPFKTLAIGFSILSIVVISTVMNPYLNERFVEGFNYDLKFEPVDELKDAKVFSNSEIDNISDLELRVILWKIACFHIVKDQKLLFGYGVGDYQDYLDYYYMYYGLAPFHYEGYSPHNQYITILVNSGLVGLFIFLIYIGYSFYQSFIKRNYLYITFLMLFCFSMIFETYLLRAKGIIFFFFFNSLFLIQHTQIAKNEDSNIRK